MIFFWMNYGLLVQPDSRVIRVCGFDDRSYNDTCYRVGSFGAKQMVCSCSEDNCNAAMGIQMPLRILAAAVVGLLLKYLA